ncbi:MAG: Hsp20/alpha crystallin family protein [Microcystaceae cyanobacterium]
MALIRFQPFRGIDELQRELNHVFDALVPTSTLSSQTEWPTFVPPAEISETPDNIHLKLEIPGLEAKDINIEITAEAVTINGERKSETKTEEQGLTRTEFRYGQFHRVVPLPVKVQNTEAKADYQNGILTLDLPKAEPEKNRVVKLNLG